MNEKSLIARIAMYPDYIREKLYSHHDALTERGYNVPSGKRLREKVRAKLNRDKKQLLQQSQPRRKQ